jgi:hypothetical protein
MKKCYCMVLLKALGRSCHLWQYLKTTKRDEQPWQMFSGQSTPKASPDLLWLIYNLLILCSIYCYCLHFGMPLVQTIWYVQEPRCFEWTSWQLIGSRTLPVLSSS